MQQANESPVRLGTFIQDNMEVILSEWEDYARRYWNGPPPAKETLRDHARMMLDALIEDMASDQSESEQKLKSEGEEPGGKSAMDRAAVRHALARVDEGFNIGSLVAEFRALRASVSRMWWESAPQPHPQQIDDMGRFNEALDQLVATSVQGFNERVDESRRLFLGILGHDLRQPMASLVIFIDVLRNPELPSADRELILSSMDKSCDFMSKMLHDLLDFTSSQLGTAMSVYPALCNAKDLCGEIIAGLRDDTSGQAIRLESSGDLDGMWDPARLRQLISNLLCNAKQHGGKDPLIQVTLRGSEGELMLSVNNGGKPIPKELQNTLFDPMTRLAAHTDRVHGSVGLGLYICQQIVMAHGGKIGVVSSLEKGTTFTALLPRTMGNVGES